MNALLFAFYLMILGRPKMLLLQTMGILDAAEMVLSLRLSFCRFDERGSKNYKVDLNHYQAEHFRAPVCVHDTDVFATYDQLIRHMPSIIDGVDCLKYIFLQPIQNSRTEVWYSRNRVSKKSLGCLVKTMVSMCGETDHYSNKSLRSTTVTRMSLGQVPSEVGMLVIGHKCVASYQKYDCSGDIRVAAAQDIISSPYDECGQLKAYPTVLHEKINNFCHSVDGVVAGQSATSIAGVSSCTGVIKQNVVDATFVAGVSSSTGAIKQNVVDASTVVAGVSSYTGTIKENVVDASTIGVSYSSVAGPVEHVSSGSAMEKFAGSSTISSHVQGLNASVVSSCAVGSCSPVVPYKIGDDIPFDESLLKELHAKSPEALGFPAKSSPTLTFNNCVVNVYFSKENVPNNYFNKENVSSDPRP